MLSLSDTEVKKYLVTPVKNRFVPDIVKNGRIQEPGIYELNKREVHRVSYYGYLVQELNPPIDDNLLLKIDNNKIGLSHIG